MVGFNLHRGLVYVAIYVISFFVWLFYRNWYPRCKTGKIGIVFSIQNSEEVRGKELYKYFEDRIRKLLGDKGMAELFDIVILDNFQTKQVNKALDAYRNSTIDLRKSGRKIPNNVTKKLNWVEKTIRGHFYIWGSIQKGSDGEMKYVIDIDGLILHSPITNELHERVANDVDTAWIDRLTIPELKELPGFESSAELILLPVQYIVGIAALVSGDLLTANELHNELLNDIKSGKYINHPRISEIKCRTIDLVAEETALLSKLYLSENNIIKSKKYLQISISIKPENYQAFLIQSIQKYSDGDVEGSVKSIVQAMNLATKVNTRVRDQTWRYSYAFLLLKRGKYKKALNQYKKISQAEYPTDLANAYEVISWNQRLDINKDFPESFFIIGYMYFHKVCNVNYALENLEKFIELTDTRDELLDLREISKTIILDIKKTMGIK